MSIYAVYLYNVTDKVLIEYLQFFETRESARDFISGVLDGMTTEMPMKRISEDEVHVLKGLHRLFPDDCYSYALKSMTLVEALNLMLKAVNQK